MLKGVNNEELLNSQIEKQIEVSKVTTNPIKSAYGNVDNNLLVDETAISSAAMKLYQKEKDISHFTNLAMSNPEDTSHQSIIENLFSKGVIDPFSDDMLTELAGNSKLIEDLGL